MMGAPSAPWAVSKLVDVCNSTLTYSDKHLLGLPVELRTKVYEHILTDIQNSPRLWNRKPSTAYDGLLLVCKQLRFEASEYIFLHRASTIGLPKLLRMLPNKTNVGMLRALNLQISHQADYRTVQCIGTILDKFQLSIQELYISFHGQDLHGNSIAINGCGHVPESHYNEKFVDLPPSGQDIDRAFTMMRQLMNLRNIRVVRLENLNLPVLQAVLFSNKQHLQAVSVVTDPRSQICDFAKLFKHHRDLFRGMLGKAEGKPILRVLELDANAVHPAGSIIPAVSENIHHLSLRIPSYEHQFQAETTGSSFEQTTGRTIQMLSVRAPSLKTLRLCITRRSRNPNRITFSWETSAISQVLAQYLPSYSSLEHLEIHDSMPDNFYSNKLISVLPYGLKRLYISDRLIGVDDLVKEVRKKYIIGLTSEYPCFDLDSDETDIQEENREVDDGTLIMSISQRGYLNFCSSDQAKHHLTDDVLIERSLSKSNDYLADNAMLGEPKACRDIIDLNAGKLGFVAFDYEVAADENNDASYRDRESSRTKIFRLNGQLLDREHNFHLASTQNTYDTCGIKPKRKHTTSQPDRESETDTASVHPEIQQALYDMAQLRWHPQYVNDVTKDFDHCFHESMEWYFGAEDEAKQVFYNEQSAPVMGQKQKCMLMEVEEKLTKRCRWWAPEYVVPPVGSFPAPVVPRDWRDDIEKRK